MKDCQSSRRWNFATLAVGILAIGGTAAAQGRPPDPTTGAYGGATYGGAAAPAPAPAPAPAAEAAPAAKAAPIASPEPAYEPMSVSEKQSFYETWGMALALGGGVEGFTNRGDTGTNTGGTWNVRASIGTKQFVGFEASYIGSAQSIDALGLDHHAVLVGNGVQGALRLNLITGMGIDPFVFGGLAWRHYNLSNQNFNTSDVRATDDVLEVPIGVGLQYPLQGFLLDARAEFRPTYYGDLFATQASNDNMNRWGVQANVGYQF